MIAPRAPTDIFTYHINYQVWLCCLCCAVLVLLGLDGGIVWWGAVLDMLVLRCCLVLVAWVVMLSSRQCLLPITSHVAYLIVVQVLMCTL